MLTHNVVIHIELPHEPDAWVDVHPLSWVGAQEARNNHLKVVASQWRDAGKVFEEIRREAEAKRPDLVEEADGAAVSVDPLLLYDVPTVLRHGVCAWSYGDEVTPESIAGLDAETAEYVARRIIPNGVVESEEARKNDSSRSTSLSTE